MSVLISQKYDLPKSKVVFFLCFTFFNTNTLTNDRNRLMFVKLSLLLLTRNIRYQP